MLDIELTNQQRQYLLYLSEKENTETLTSIAKHFNCSKVNSKKILDRMVKIGIIYKENNRMILTDLGSKIANSQLTARDEIALVLEEGLSIEKNKAIELANTMFLEESRGFRNHLLLVAKHFSKLGNRQGDKLSFEEMVQILGQGEFKTYFVVFRDERRDMASFTPLSMAMRGFHNEAIIKIDEDLNASLSLRVKPVTETYESTDYTCKSQIVVYRDEENEYSLPVGEYCTLPFELFTSWYYTGGGMLQSCVWLEMHTNINVEHRHMAKFVFTINLFNLN